MNIISRIIYIIVCTGTAMVGYSIHHSVGWAIIDWLFWPVAWVKWLVCHEVSLSLIKSTFSFFFT
jgi:hypothetical protein